jgi:hypothetical protein
MAVADVRRVLTRAVVTAGVLAFSAPSPSAWAQDADPWSFVVTPQVWVSHIAKNGFNAPGVLGGILLGNPSNPATRFTDVFDDRSTTHAGTVSPQVGVQIAAQRGRLTVAGAFQYAEFVTRTDIVFAPPVNVGAQFIPGPVLRPGDLAARESVSTRRFDMDVAVSYAFPDVVRDRVDATVGLGIKFIYADATRHFGDVHPAIGFADFGGLYTVCRQDDCGADGDPQFVSRVKTQSWLYGLTIPTGAAYRLTSDARALLTLGVSPFLGAETRNDRNVIYAFTERESVRGQEIIDRLDGTTFAYGATADVAFRYAFTDTVSAYGGWRVQYIKGHETYLAYGPLFGMSFRFGGR